MILVSGATGMFGGRIARGLVDAGKPVRALVPDMLVKYAGMSLDQVELGVLVHYRAWKRGDADLVTDTVEELTGRKPTTIDEWLAHNLAAFR